MIYKLSEFHDLSALPGKHRHVADPATGGLFILDVKPSFWPTVIKYHEFVLKMWSDEFHSSRDGLRDLPAALRVDVTDFCRIRKHPGAMLPDVLDGVKLFVQFSPFTAWQLSYRFIVDWQWESSFSILPDGAVDERGGDFDRYALNAGNQPKTIDDVKDYRSFASWCVNHKFDPLDEPRRFQLSWEAWASLWLQYSGATEKDGEGMVQFVSEYEEVSLTQFIYDFKLDEKFNIKEPSLPEIPSRYKQHRNFDMEDAKEVIAAHVEGPTILNSTVLFCKAEPISQFV